MRRTPIRDMTNTRSNIVQADGNCNPNFVVVDGQRSDSGHLAPGGKKVSSEMPRPQAIALADKLQAEEVSPCSECGVPVRIIVGCPDGAELCDSCFNAGIH